MNLIHSKKRKDARSDDVFEGEPMPAARREEECLGTILTLNTRTVEARLEKGSRSNLMFEPLRVTIPEKRDADDSLKIQTIIETYDNLFLLENQSGLTVPITQTDLRSLGTARFSSSSTKYPATRNRAHRLYACVTAGYSSL